MTLVRPIDVGELPTFTSLDRDPVRAADQAAYVERLIRIGSMRQAWCYLAERGALPVGRFAFWTLPKIDKPIAIVLLDVSPLVEDRAEVAAASSSEPPPTRWRRTRPSWAT